MIVKKVVINKGRELPIKNRHRWIFSGSIREAPEYFDGEILEVYSYNDEFLGHAYFNNGTNIIGRMINFDKTDPLESIKNNIIQSVNLRKRMFDENTNCYRVINGEGDGIPGLVVDQYSDVLVIQISTKGIDNLRKFIVGTLVDVFSSSIKCIYENSTMHARVKDGLKPAHGFVFGMYDKELRVRENGLEFIVDFIQGQKTGFFLDMRDMRMLVGGLSKNKKVLNSFSYTGAFSVYSKFFGAKCIDTVDISAGAIESAKRNFEANNFDTQNCRFIKADVFKFLRENDLDYDLIILDPPAFAKKKSDLEGAKRGYIEINKTAISKINPGGFVLTCSCSYHLNRDVFENVIMRAARQANRDVRILSRHRLAPDHPINIFHPEIDYLKSLILHVS